MCVCIPFDSITLLHLHVHILSPVCCCCYYYYYYYCQVCKDDDIFVKRFTPLNKFCANLWLFILTYQFWGRFCRPFDLVPLLCTFSYHIYNFCFVCLLLRFCVFLLFLCFVCVFLLTLQPALVLLSLHFNKCPLGWTELNWIIVVVGIKISTPVLQAVTGVIAHARLLLWAV